MQLHAYCMQGWIHPADVFVTLFGKDEYAFWLDREQHHTQRFSVLGHAYGNRVFTPAEAHAALAERAGWGDVPSDADTTLPFAFRPGFVGWQDYPQDPLAGIDDAHGTWLEVREALVFDHAASRVYFVGYFATKAAFQHWLEAAMLRLALSGGQQIGYKMRNAAASPAVPVSIAHTDDSYLGLIARAQQHIAAGDVYQLCLTNRIELEHSANTLEVFLRLRESNPAPYAAYVRAGDTALVCSSPEQFLSVSANGQLSTRPIKGTRPRSADTVIDAANAAELANDPKERAENLMIVDLMRNDLARVAEPNTVAVTQLFEVESYATVHQLVSTVEAQLQTGATVEQALSAAFPGGSMTGAPKIRAMQLIDQLEGAPRGVYSGVVGHLGIDGSADLGMVIRSLVFHGSTVSLGVGGGITIDSNPEAELEETKLKAAALLSALNSPDPWQVLAR